MKVAMLSDFHLGYERFREDAYRQAEEALTKAAKSADVLLIPGDIFDNREPSPDVLAEAITLFMNLKKNHWSAKVVSSTGEGRFLTDIPVIAIPGTHERRAEGVEDPVDLLGLAGLLVDATNAQIIIEKEGERIAVRGLGGIADDRFRGVVEREAPKPVDGLFNILFFHQSVYEMLPFSEDYITVDELPKGFDLYVNGHVHSRVEMKAHGKPFLVSGSTVLTQLKSGEQEPKGFFVYDTKSKEYAFNRINSRRFVHVKVSVDGKAPAQIEEHVESTIKQLAAEGDKPIIRIEFSGKMKDGYKNLDIDTAGIIKRYQDSAIIEIGRLGVEAQAGEKGMEKRSALPDGASIKDYGLGIFMTRLKENKYDMEKNPTELFEILSAEESKDKSTKKAMDYLLD